jgi:hypothetical protein
MTTRRTKAVPGVEIEPDVNARLVEMVTDLARDVEQLNATITAVDQGARAMTGLVAAQFLALRDLLVQNGVVSAKEAFDAAVIVDLEAMLHRDED